MHALPGPLRPCFHCVTLAVVFKLLSDKEFGPKYYGLFENGRIEGWIPAGPLDPPQMGYVRPTLIDMCAIFIVILMCTQPDGPP